MPPGCTLPGSEARVERTIGRNRVATSHVRHPYLVFERLQSAISDSKRTRWVLRYTWFWSQRPGSPRSILTTLAAFGFGVLTDNVPLNFLIIEHRIRRSVSAAGPGTQVMSLLVRSRIVPVCTTIACRPLVLKRASFHLSHRLAGLPPPLMSLLDAPLHAAEPFTAGSRKIDAFTSRRRAKFADTHLVDSPIRLHFHLHR